MRCSPWASVPALLLLSLAAVCPAEGAGGGFSADGFIENRGQLDPEVRFYAPGRHATVFFTASGPVIELRGELPAPGETHRPIRDNPTRARERRKAARKRVHVLRVRIPDVGPAAVVEGRAQRAGRHHFLLGGARDRFHARVPAFDEVVYRDVLPGTDLVYRVLNGELVYESVGSEGGRMRPELLYEGASDVRVSCRGREVMTPAGSLLDDGTSIRVLSPIGLEPESGATAGSVDQANGSGTGPRWSSFLGGARDDAIYAVAIDDGRFPVVAGLTRSVDFPTTVGALDPTYEASFDAVVSKFDEDGATLMWSTYLGGSEDDRAWALEVDSLGRPVVVGVTGSPLFPTSSGAYDETHNGGYDAFVAKLEADGSALLWSTFYGGSGREWDVSGAVLDSAGRAILIGSTQSTDLPTTAGAHATSLVGSSDAFVATIESDGSALVAATYLGGTGFDAAEDVSVDRTDRPVLTGRTQSSDFPVTAGVFQPVPADTGSAQDCFVSRLETDASLSFSTFLGGGALDECFTIALDSADRPVVAGSSESDDFPTSVQAFRRFRASAADVVAAALSPDGTSLAWGTYVGGGDALAVAVDGHDRPHLAGWTCSPDFPMAGSPFDDDPELSCEVFLSRLDKGGRFLGYSTYAGGWYSEFGYAIALDGLDRPVAGGETFSWNFPVTAGAFDTEHNSPDDWYDGFVLTLLTPTFCTHVAGTTSLTLEIEKAQRGNCPQTAPEARTIDLIEGELARLGPTDIGDVRRVACGAGEVTFDDDVGPAPGEGLFQLARLAGGAYTDDAGPGLQGTRTALSGDCP